MALSNNNKRPSRVATRATRETHASKLAVKERRAVANASKVPPPLKGDAGSNFEAHCRVIEEAKRGCNINNG
jgi:hypothetical protein